MTVESTDFELETHNRQVSETVASARRALKTAEEHGSLPDWLKAPETTLKMSDYAGRELVRFRLRKHLLEAANGPLPSQDFCLVEERQHDLDHVWSTSSNAGLLYWVFKELEPGWTRFWTTRTESVTGFPYR